MDYSAKSNKIETLASRCLVVAVYAGKKARLGDNAALLDRATGGRLKALVAKGDILATVFTNPHWGGGITAALFMSEFVENTRWAHIDIAGPAYSKKAGPYCPPGGTGFGVRLDSYISSLRKKESPEPGLFDVISGSIGIMQDRITRSRMAGEPPDIHITPKLSHIGLMDFDRAEESIAEGVEATRRKRSEIEALPEKVRKS